MPPDTIAYQIRDSLYLNITNRCTDNCTFCVRNFTDFVKGHNLKLKKEPTLQEILDAAGDPARYKEIVFCGYGEPTLRLDVILEVSKKLKEKSAHIRLNTNGHGNLINKRSIVNQLAACMDEASVSLNVDTKENYNKICRPQFGPDTFDKVLEFVKECKNNGIKTSITCIEMPGVDIDKCKKIAQNLGVGFRQRQLNVVG